MTDGSFRFCLPVSGLVRFEQGYLMQGISVPSVVGPK
jgi:hypothetical protein